MYRKNDIWGSSPERQWSGIPRLKCPDTRQQLPAVLGYTEAVASIYSLKPGFQRLLRPLSRMLARAGVTANHVTVLACALSVVIGLLLTARIQIRPLLLILPVFLFLRMAMNAIDGMLARELMD